MYYRRVVRHFAAKSVVSILSLISVQAVYAGGVGQNANALEEIIVSADFPGTLCTRLGDPTQVGVTFEWSFR